jgi:hypothetical protein
MPMFYILKKFKNLPFTSVNTYLLSMTLSTYMDRKRIILKYGTNHDENLLKLYGNIKELYPWGQGHYNHICNKKM